MYLFLSLVPPSPLCVTFVCLFVFCRFVCLSLFYGQFVFLFLNSCVYKERFKTDLMDQSPLLLTSFIVDDEPDIRYFRGSDAEMQSRPFLYE